MLFRSCEVKKCMRGTSDDGQSKPEMVRRKPNHRFWDTTVYSLTYPQTVKRHGEPKVSIRMRVCDQTTPERLESVCEMLRGVRMHVHTHRHPPHLISAPMEKTQACLAFSLGMLRTTYMMGACVRVCACVRAPAHPHP